MLPPVESLREDRIALRKHNLNNLDWTKSVFEAVKGHPKEALACLAMIIACILYALDAGPIVAAGIPATIYLLYFANGYMDNAHNQRLAELDVEKTEITHGQRARAKAHRALEKRRNANAKR